MRPSRSPSPDRSAEKVIRTGHRRAVGPAQGRLVPRRGARIAPSITASIGASGTAAPMSDRPGLPDRAAPPTTPVISSAARLNAVIRCSRSTAIDPGPDRLEDQILERLQVAQILLPGLELLPGGAVSLAETAGHDGDHEKGRRVEEHRDELERRRLLGRVDERRISGSTVRATTMPGVEHAAGGRDGEPARPGQQHAGGGDATARTGRRRSSAGRPVAATTAVMSAVSSRQMNHVEAAWAGPAGGSRSTAPAEVSATSSARTRTGRSPGTGPGETNGPSASRTAATPSRAQENPRSGPPTFSALTHGHLISVTSGRSAGTSRPRGRRPTTPRKTIMIGSSSDVSARDRGVDFVVVEVGDLGEHRVERAGVLADRDHVHDHGREHGACP